MAAVSSPDGPWHKMPRMRLTAIGLAALVSLVSACGARSGLDAPANDEGGGGGGGSPGICGSCFQSDLDGTCTTTLTAAPFHVNSDGSFQSTPGTGYQTTIEIGLSSTTTDVELSIEPEHGHRTRWHAGGEAQSPPLLAVAVQRSTLSQRRLEHR